MMKSFSSATRLFKYPVVPRGICVTVLGRAPRGGVDTAKWRKAWLLSCQRFLRGSLNLSGKMGTSSLSRAVRWRVELHVGSRESALSNRCQIGLHEKAATFSVVKLPTPLFGGGRAPGVRGAKGLPCSRRRWRLRKCTTSAYCRVSPWQEAIPQLELVSRDDGRIRILRAD